MTDLNELYAELRVEIEAVVNPLFEFSEQCLRRRGNFLPHGAVLDARGRVGLVAAGPENNAINSTDVLPLLHQSLRAQSKESETVAVGVAENVTITQYGQSVTAAIKVLFEHKRGLVVALYLPFKKRLMRGYSFGQVYTVLADGEVNAWSD